MRLPEEEVLAAILESPWESTKRQLEVAGEVAASLNSATMREALDCGLFDIHGVPIPVHRVDEVSDAFDEILYERTVRMSVEDAMRLAEQVLDQHENT